MTDPETASSRELLTADIVVCGGGLAGLCAAVAAARHGAQVILVGDRPVLGGCSSSEIRVSPQGAAHFHGYARESGIISELIIADRMVNHAATGGTGWTNSVWDMILYDLVQRTPGITLLLNTSIDGVEMVDHSRIGAVLARTAGAERKRRLAGNLYVDSTGDGVVAAMAGNAWRMGSEGRAEFGELHAPLEPSDGVQGTSIQIMTKNVGYPIGFTAPDWAEYYDDEKFFHEGGRIPDSTRSGWWWLELGTPWDTIRDNEVIRHELTRHALGVWDWIKNRSTEYQDRFANFALDWIGQVPGKRESRRIEGRHRITEHDLLRERLTGEGSFPDEVAYGGWNIDLHTPGGLLASSSEATAAEGYRLGGSASITTAVPPFGIPLRALIARDVDNLFLAGRDISTTHVALGAVRVQGTTSLMGQAVGTAAAMLLSDEAPSIQNDGYRIPSDLSSTFVPSLQQTLLRDGVFLPHVVNSDPGDLALSAATVEASSCETNQGMGPDATSFDVEYIGPEEFASGADEDELTFGRSQWIAVETGEGAPGIDAVGLYLSNASSTPIELQVCLEPVDGIWDYEVRPERALRRAVLVVPPGGPHWVNWEIDVDGAELTSGYVRLNAKACPEVSWLRANGVLPGCLAGVAVAPERLQRFRHGVSLCHRVSPAQRVWEAEQIVSGVARPVESTNQWRSRSEQDVDGQWVSVSWNDPVVVGQVDLQWCGHLLRDYDQLPVRRADPETVRDYVVQVWSCEQDEWLDVVVVNGNVQTHRVHNLEVPVRTSSVRILIHATNGADYASLYGLRVYSEPTVCSAH